METIAGVVLTVTSMSAVLYLGLQKAFKTISPLIPSLGFILIRSLPLSGVGGLAAIMFAVNEAFVGLELNTRLL